MNYRLTSKSCFRITLNVEAFFLRSLRTVLQWCFNRIRDILEMVFLFQVKLYEKLRVIKQLVRNKGHVTCYYFLIDL